MNHGHFQMTGQSTAVTGLLWPGLASPGSDGIAHLCPSCLRIINKDLQVPSEVAGASPVLQILSLWQNREGLGLFTGKKKGSNASLLGTPRTPAEGSKASLL